MFFQWDLFLFGMASSFSLLFILLGALLLNQSEN